MRHLLALGSGTREAILTVLSSKGYWRLSRTLATQSGMTNAWLESHEAPERLINIRALRMEAHGHA